MDLKNKLIGIAGISGAIAVALGAMGAHALKAVISTAQLKSFETGNRYQMYHTIVILILALLIPVLGEKLVKRVAYLMLLGIVLFSGSIYLLATKDLLGISAFKSILGPITPLGGLCFITAWMMLAIGGFKMKKIK